MIGRLLRDVEYLTAGSWVVVKDADAGCEYHLLQGSCMGWNVWVPGVVGVDFEMIPRARSAIGGEWRAMGSENAELCRVVNGYLVAALWSTHDYRYPEGGEVDGDDYHDEPFDRWAGIDDCTERLVVHALADCSAMMAEVGRAFDRYCARIGSAGDGSSAAERFGDDFWLTREGHGCGFWDRGLDTLGRYLTDVAHRYGSVDLYSVPVAGADDEVEQREVTL